MADSVVLITVDCLRQDHVSAYDYDRQTTPYLESISEDSLQFSRAYANGPGTSVSFPSIFSSTYPFDYGGYTGLGHHRTSVAEVLQSQSIKTIGVHSNTFLSKFYNYDRGFEEYESNVNGETQALNSWINKIDETVFGGSALVDKAKRIAGRGLGKIQGEELPYWPAKKTTDKAIQHLSNVSKDSYFLWVHYMDVHAPHHPPDRHFEQFSSADVDWNEHHNQWINARDNPKDDFTHLKQQFIDAYDAELRYVDEQISRLMDHIERNSNHSPLYIITSDHGEELFDNGTVGHQYPTLSEELLHIPLILYSESNGVLKDPQTELVSQLDIPPTILSWYGIDPPNDYRGTSMNNINEDTKQDILLSEVCHRAGAPDIGEVDLDESIISVIHKEGIKYIKDNQRNQETIHNLWKNGTKSHNSNQEVTQVDLEKIIEKHLSSLYQCGDTRVDEVPDDVKEQLEDLGYTG